MKQQYAIALTGSAAIVFLVMVLMRPSATTPVKQSPKAPRTTPAPSVSARPSQPGVNAALPQSSATPAPRIAAPVAAPDSPPVIVSVSLNPPVVQAGQSVSGTVITSSNVASVEARIGGYGASLAKTGVGKFHLTYLVPDLLPPFRRTYAVEIIARNARGDQASTQAAVTVR